MASDKRRLATNVDGDFYVDASCIDCDTCRWMAPATFDRQDEQSRVHRQPDNDVDRTRAQMALIACPTSSIHTVTRHDLLPAVRAFPDPIADGVYHCGFHSEKSFGAASYLIVRPQGNVMIDSPRFAAPLVRRIEELGGIHTLFLTHCDDVADHQHFRDRFGCERILHRADQRTGTRDVERVIDGDQPIALADDLLLLPTPGHTEGSVCLLYRDEFLFTGDHLAYSESRQGLYAFRGACWYDWYILGESMLRLQQYRFSWVLPGHGQRKHLPAAEMAVELARCVAETRSQG